MHVHAALSQVNRQHDVADRLAGAEMNRLQRAERRAQHHLGADLVAVERGDVAAGQAKPHGFEIHPRRAASGGTSGSIRPSMCRVQSSSLSLLNASKRRAGLRLLTVAEQLQRPGRVAWRRVPFRLPVPKDHRAVQLAVLQGDRAGALAPEHPRSHRTEHRARHHHLVEHPVIVQPRGILRADSEANTMSPRGESCRTPSSACPASARRRFGAPIQCRRRWNG